MQVLCLTPIVINMNLVEGIHYHNGRKPSSIKRWIVKQIIPRASAQVPFDWNKGVDNTTKVSKIKNQFQSYSCWGQHIAYILEIITGKEFSAKSFYSRCFASGGGVEESVGQTSLNTSGGNFEASVPSYKPDGSVDESFMEDTSYLTKEIVDEALTNAGWKKVDISIDMDSIAHAIDEYFAVGIELEGKNWCNWLSANPLPPVSSNPNESWYHYMCFAGAGQPLGYQRLKALQSWGEVGEHGIQYFQSNYLPYFLSVTGYYKPIIIPPVVLETKTIPPLEVPLQSTSTLSITHNSSLCVSFWTFVLELYIVLFVKK